MSDYRLGKKVEVETVEVEDEWMPFKGAHGTNMERSKKTGAIRTDQTPKGPQYPDAYQHMLDILKKQEEDGFLVTFWGVL